MLAGFVGIERYLPRKAKILWKMPRADEMNSTNVCDVCHRTSPYISSAIGICGECLLKHFHKARSNLRVVHADSRAEFNLPAQPPRASKGIRCNICCNECVIGENEYGYCGLRTVKGNKLVHLAGIPARGFLHWYRDPVPTNCVADWVCGGEQHRGCHNLAVFYASCTMNCLFCQNWHFRQMSPAKMKLIGAKSLASEANSRTFCVCYFGGDPASQMPHALAVSRYLSQQGVRICWETNGTMHPKLLDAALQYSFETGGCIKFDLKAFDDELHLALTGVSNRRTLENFARVSRKYGDRPQSPLVVASTLLVPGYVESDQVAKIAQYIAALNPQIPYTLLAFAPHFRMDDLPYTLASLAHQAESAARAAGLTRVRVGNKHLLG
jgi:pyruvate formate lyase activating enzyme